MPARSKDKTPDGPATSLNSDPDTKRKPMPRVDPTPRAVRSKVLRHLSSRVLPSFIPVLSRKSRRPIDERNISARNTRLKSQNSHFDKL